MNPPGRGLYSSARNLLGTTLELVQVRLALFASDVENGVLNLFDALVLALLALVGLSLGVLMLCALVLMLVQDGYRVPVLLVMVVAFVGGGLWALRSARARLQRAGGSFEASRAELQRDVALLRVHTPPGPPASGG